MYYIRVDDLQSDMDEKIFQNIIDFFENIETKPLLAIIPYVKDQKIWFWQKLKELQDKWYTIWLHWYNHQIHTNSKWNKSIIPIQDYSEFVWLSYEKQNKKIKQWLEIFTKYWIKTDIFIAPAHWQDLNTLKALKNNNITKISDWFFLFPKLINSIIFYPQQLWQYRYVPFWIKTVCLHIPDFKSTKTKILDNIKYNKSKFDDYENIFMYDWQWLYKKIINNIFEKIRFFILKIMKKW